MKFLLSLLVSLLFLTLIFYYLPLEEVSLYLKSIEIKTLTFSFLLYSLSQFTRSVRWSIILSLPLRESFFLNSANLFLNNVLPARSGEISWFYYAKKLGVNFKYSLWSFTIGRVYDLIALAFIVFVSYLLVKKGLIFAYFGVLFGFILAILIPYTVNLIPEFWKFTDLKNFLKRELNLKLSLYLFTLSGISFFLKAISTYLLVKSLLNLNFFKYTLGFLGGELSSILPVHSFMGFGTYEAGFLLPLKLIGFEVKEGLKVGFIVHNFLLLSSAFWGIVSILYLHTFFRRSP